MFIVINILPFDTSHGWKSEVERCINKTGHQLHQCIKDSAYPAEEMFQLKQYTKPNITNLRSNNSIKVVPYFRNFYHGRSQSLQLDHGVITDHYVSTFFLEVKINSNILIADSKIQYDSLNPNVIPKTMIMLKPNKGQILAYLKVHILCYYAICLFPTDTELKLIWFFRQSDMNLWIYPSDHANPILDITLADVLREALCQRLGASHHGPDSQ